MILAIDQGTTGTTCLVVDGDAVLGRGYRPVEQVYPRPGWVEHDPLQLWSTVTGAAEDAVASAGVAARDLEAIGITNQRETTVLWDRRSGRPVANAIVWQDRRTAEACAALPAALLRDRTGLVPDPYFSATKLAWLLDHAGSADGLAFGTVDSWLIWQLTGGEVHATEPTNASRTLLCALDTLDWDAELLELFDVPASVLPEILPSSGEFGEGTLLGASLPVRGVAGDQQAALYGQACLGRGQAKVTYGTGSFLLVNDGTSREPPPHGLVRTAAAQPGVTALEGSVFVSGAAVQWLRDGLGLLADAAESERLAESIEDTGGVYFVPALTGLGSPHWDPAARGLIAGITRGTGRAELVRAALEAIAYQVRDVVEAVPGGVSALRADGGAAANAWLMQFQADLLGLPVEVAPEREMTAMGAAALASGSPPQPRPGAVYEPRMSRDQADALYRGWLAAVQRARSDV
ncbi:MAG TPA: glycerol kinase GlpK [Gaiellales bacterium]|nr:glycerol kinase GlpK [Gaiellales bacterium]